MDVLATIDPLTGAANVVAPLSGQISGDIHSMAFSPDGVLYAREASPTHIVKIDPLTAEVTRISTPTSTDRVGQLQGLEFGPDGLLYGWGIYGGIVNSVDGGLAILKPETGVIVDVNPNVGGPGVQSLVFLEDGTLLGHYDSSRYCPPSPFPCTEEIEGTLVKIDPLTGATSPAGTNVAREIRGLAIYKVPEIQVGIDVRPGSDSNPINLASQGLVPVTIFTTDEFDAARVNVSSVVWAGANVAQRDNGSYFSSLDDVDGDGDLVLHFRLADSDLLDIYEDLLRDDLADGTLDAHRQSVDIALEGLTNNDGSLVRADTLDLFLTAAELVGSEVAEVGQPEASNDTINPCLVAVTSAP